MAFYALCVLEPFVAVTALCVLEPLWPLLHFVCLSLCGLYAFCMLEPLWPLCTLCA